LGLGWGLGLGWSIGSQDTLQSFRTDSGLGLGLGLGWGLGLGLGSSFPITKATVFRHRDKWIPNGNSSDRGYDSIATFPHSLTNSGHFKNRFDYSEYRESLPPIFRISFPFQTEGQKVKKNQENQNNNLANCIDLRTFLNNGQKVKKNQEIEPNMMHDFAALNQVEINLKVGTFLPIYFPSPPPTPHLIEKHKFMLRDNQNYSQKFLTQQLQSLVHSPRSHLVSHLRGLLRCKNVQEVNQRGQNALSTDSASTPTAAVRPAANNQLRSRPEPAVRFRCVVNRLRTTSDHLRKCLWF
jgi:hypothetical protein